MKIYVVGSLRKPETEDFARRLRNWGHDAFLDWRAAGPRADDEWREHFQREGKTYKQALESDFVRTFADFDGRHIDDSDAVVGLNPTGQSAGLELFYGAITCKLTVAYYDKQPERWDGMWHLIKRADAEAAFYVLDNDAELYALLGGFA